MSPRLPRLPHHPRRNLERLIRDLGWERISLCFHVRHEWTDERRLSAFHVDDVVMREPYDAARIIGDKAHVVVDAPPAHGERDQQRRDGRELAALEAQRAVVI